MQTIRPHYSWSQHSLFLSSKLSFYKKYVLGEETRSNIRFDKGKEFGEFKETGEKPHWVEDPLLETVAGLIPNLDNFEEKLEIDMFAGADAPVWAKPILMFSDASMNDGTLVDEYKTGKVPWTQQLVDDHQQLDFYAMCYFIKSGQTTIPKFRLWWIETEDITAPNGDLLVRYTGHVECFEREFTEKDILNMMMKVMKTMQEIYEYEYEELELEDSLVDRYIELQDIIKEAEDELSTIKLRVETEINETGLKYAVAKAGKFSVSQRRSYKYSKDLSALKVKYDKEVKAKQSQEVKDGVAKESISESIRFTRSK